VITDGDKPEAVLVTLGGEGGDIAIGFRLDRRRQHPAGSFADDLVQPRGQFRAGIIISQYSQHWRSFPPASHRQR